MALFDVRSRKSPGRGWPDTVPAGFDAVAEMLRDSRRDPESLRAAGRDAGRAAADSGTTIEALLDDLATVCQGATGSHPDFRLMRAVAEGWSDAQLGYLHSLSCEDPLTGLTSIHHVRTRLTDAYRAADRDGVEPQVALVLIDIVDRGAGLSRLDRTMRLVHVSEMLRTVYSGDETLGQLSGSRAVAVVRRDESLATTVRGLRDLLAGWASRGGPTTRVWIEGLPSSLGAAVTLLDELTR
jgi:GGDEF domain-containing protein